MLLVIRLVKLRLRAVTTMALLVPVRLCRVWVTTWWSLRLKFPAGLLSSSSLGLTSSSPVSVSSRCRLFERLQGRCALRLLNFSRVVCLCVKPLLHL